MPIAWLTGILVGNNQVVFGQGLAMSLLIFLSENMIDTIQMLPFAGIDSALCYFECSSAFHVHNLTAYSKAIRDF